VTITQLVRMELVRMGPPPTGAPDPLAWVKKERRDARYSSSNSASSASSTKAANTSRFGEYQRGDCWAGHRGQHREHVGRPVKGSPVDDAVLAPYASHQVFCNAHVHEHLGGDFCHQADLLTAVLKRAQFTLELIERSNSMGMRSTVPRRPSASVPASRPTTTPMRRNRAAS
jgi:hypothetical protein